MPNMEASADNQTVQEKSRPKPPSWMAPAAQNKAAAAPQPADGMSQGTSVSASSPTPANETVKPKQPASASTSAGDFPLLGAPAAVDDDLDELLGSTAVPEEKTKNEVHPLACVVGGFTAPLHLENITDANKEKNASAAQKKAPAIEGKLRSEFEQLNEIVDAVESLDYLKPRLKRIALNGCEASDLVGLYRMVSQVLLDNMRTQIKHTRQMRDNYEKRLREIIIDKSSELVQMVTGGKTPAATPANDNSVTAEPTEEIASVPEGSVMMLRKQLEIKEELLLKAREAQEEAEARYDKAVSDVANIRQRQEKDIALRLQKSREALLNKILPTLDSFDSALAAAHTFVDISSVIEGLSNIHKQLLDACMSEGLQPIEAKGQPFDPALHESMGYVTTDEVPEDYVAADLRRGYMLNDKLLRATMVQVARHE